MAYNLATFLLIIFEEEFEDTKGVIRIRISKKDDNTIDEGKRTKIQTTIYKTYM
jgi:hypothetical protein